MDRMREKGLFEGRKSIGLLNLRKDRGDRTMQWFGALQEKDAFAFDRLVFVGEHAQALKAKLRNRIKPEIAVFKGKNPEEVIAQMASLEKDETVVFGMGNMGGIGRSLVDYWEYWGARYDV